MESLLLWISHYGYAGLFGLLLLGIVGLPVPDETLLVFSGYLIFKGRLNPALTFMAGSAGAICGISISYLIGRTLKHEFVDRYGRYLRITPERLDRVHRWFLKMGDWLLAVGYFVPGLRHFTALLAGMSDLEYPTFAAFAYAGAAVWVATFLTLGFLVGDEWRATMQLVHRYTFVSILGIALILLIAMRLYRR